ncbi:MAG: drug/metabolite exporter YedA [Myxococcales bacterium]|nr:drug/metabolite exporter YedA [Myxococcales bacterium]
MPPASPAPPSSRRSLVIASYAAVCTLWGSTYLAIAVALEGFPPYLLGALRFLLAGSALLAVARWRKEPWPERRQWLGAAVAGLFLFVLGNGLIAAAERSLSSSVTSVLAATMPLWMTVFGRLLGTPVRRSEAVGVALGLVGVLVMNTSGELRASPAGVVMVLLSPMAWAVGSLVGQRLPSPPGLMRVGSQMLTGGLQMAVVSLALGERMAHLPSGRAVAAAMYLLVAGSLIGFSAYSYLLQHTRPAVATSYAYVNPVIAMALGILLAGETFDVAGAVGAAIILAAILLVGLARHHRPQAVVLRELPRAPDEPDDLDGAAARRGRQRAAYQHD